MASPAAVLSVLVKADGIARTNSQIQSLHGDLGKSSKAALRMGDDLDKGSRKGSKALGALKSGAGLAIGALGAVGLAGAVKTAVGEFEEARKVGANTNQVIKSTGGVAKISAKQVAELSTSISKKAGIDDEAIQSGANLLLTFKNIRNETGKGKDIFNQATKAAVDLSAAGFGSLSSTSKQLGKALNDPVKGMTALGKSGVTFSEDQKKAIEALLKTGKAADRVKAQQIILREVQSQVGGQAAAQATTMDKLKVTLGNLAEAAGAVLVPALDKVGRFLVTVINQMIEGKGAGGAIVSTFRTLGGVIGKLAGIISTVTAPAVKVLVTAVGEMGRALHEIWATSNTLTFLGKLDASFESLTRILRETGPVGDAIADMLERVRSVVVPLGAALISLVTYFVQNKTAALALAAAASVLAAAYVASLVPALIASTAAIYAQVAGWVALRIAFLASPIGMIVTGLALLAAGIVIAWRESETFRTIILGAWAAIKAVAGWLVTAGVAAFNAIKDSIVGAWNLVKTVTLAVWGAIGTYLTNAWNDIKDAAIQVWHAIDQTVIGAWNGIKTVTSTVWNAIKTVLLTVWGAFKTIALTEFNLLKGVIVGVWNAIKTVTSTVWNAIKTVATTIWGAIGGAIMTPIRAARDVLATIWDKIKSVAVTAFEGLKKAIKTAADPILDVILWPFKQAAKKVGAFAKLILTVIEKIPGVGNDKIDSAKGAIDKLVGGLAEGGTVSKSGVQALAEGGIVRKPIVMMGEEAPRHPEYVIPTNPAYRGRAQMLLAQAAGAIGLAGGGVLGKGQLVDLAQKVNMPDPNLMAAIALAESGGRTDAFGPPSGKGLWQVEWNVWGKRFASMDPYKAMDNAIMAHTILREQGINAWVAYTNGSYKQFLGGAGKNVLGPGIGDLNPLDFINKLPGLGDLPDWLKGTGSYILDHVKDFIKDKVGGLVGSGGTGGKVAGSVEKAIALAATFGFARPGPGQLTGGGHVAGSLHYAGRAADFGDAGHTPQQMQSLFFGLWNRFGDSINELFYDKTPWYVDAHKKIPGHFGGHDDHVHVAFAKGGILGGGEPFVGSYRNGGRVPADGYGYLHQGETVVPRGAGGPLVHIEHMEIREETDVARVARSLAWQLETGMA